MLERFKKSDIGMPTAHYVQNSPSGFDYNRATANRRGRGGRNGRGGGRFGFNNTNSRVQCQLCGRLGHVVWNCYHRFDHSFNPNSGNPSTTPQIPYINAHPPPPPANFHQPTAFLTAPSSSLSDASWLADSGASHHLTPDPSNLLSSFASNTDANQVFVGNGTGIAIKNSGSFILYDKYTNISFCLKNLLHVPQITQNLLSVSRFAAENGVFFEFWLDFCVIRDQATRNFLLQGIVRNGVYSFDTLRVPKPNTQATALSCNSNFHHDVVPGLDNFN
ncbi:uncharacterized protein LOC107632877 [Arachis ipaensis]|uniref:uncharacterized protein LOC107632877 n=1 Tax=Arachis ipaensis TaxID=130454 RepID=UPI0007AFD797|nr:uncharacterized protein LOC107632877 [Arachis ipaensis]